MNAFQPCKKGTGHCNCIWMVSTNVTRKCYLCQKLRWDPNSKFSDRNSTTTTHIYSSPQEEALYSFLYIWTPPLHHIHQGIHEYIPLYSRRFWPRFKPLQSAVEADQQTKTLNTCTTTSSLHEGRVLHGRYRIPPGCPHVIIFALGQGIVAMVFPCWVSVSTAPSSRAIQPSHKLVPCRTSIAVQACHCSFIPYGFIIFLLLLLSWCSPPFSVLSLQCSSIPSRCSFVFFVPSSMFVLSGFESILFSFSSFFFSALHPFLFFSVFSVLRVFSHVLI